MPAHSSHLLQPCDIGYFTVLKRLYGQQIGSYVRNGLNHIDKYDFLQAYLVAHTESMSIANNYPEWLCSYRSSPT
jgi:DDE superfamily endonuclease